MRQHSLLNTFNESSLDLSSSLPGTTGVVVSHSSEGLFGIRSLQTPCRSKLAQVLSPALLKNGNSNIGVLLKFAHVKNLFIIAAYAVKRHLRKLLRLRIILKGIVLSAWPGPTSEMIRCHLLSNSNSVCQCCECLGAKTLEEALNNSMCKQPHHSQHRADLRKVLRCFFSCHRKSEVNL